MTRRAALAALLLAGAGALARAGEYHLGQGYADGALNLAGYANVLAAAPRGEPARLLFDDLSLFVGARLNRYVNPFFEAELTEATLWRQGARPFAAARPRAVLERLYNDSELGGDFSLRVGKMLTPVGEWNTIHAAPLVPSINQPMTTYRGFNEYTSGLSLNYFPQNAASPDLQLYWQPGRALAPKADAVRRYAGAAGLHLSFPTGLNDKVGLSLQRARVEAGAEAQTVLGVNVRKTLGRFQFETEATYAELSGANPARLRAHEWGAYLLGAYALDDQLSLTARHEHFLDRGAPGSARDDLLGLLYRPDPALAWKLEYIRHRGAALDVKSGLYASFSVLF